MGRVPALRALEPLSAGDALGGDRSLRTRLPGHTYADLLRQHRPRKAERRPRARPGRRSRPPGVRRMALRGPVWSAPPTGDANHGSGLDRGGALVAGSVAAAFVAGATTLYSFWTIPQAIEHWYRSRVILRLRDEFDEPIRVQRNTSTRRASSRAPTTRDGTSGSITSPGGTSGRGLRSEKTAPHDDRARQRAIGLAGQLMAHANRRGGGRKAVRTAVARIEEAGHPEAFLPRAADLALRDFSKLPKSKLSTLNPEQLMKPLPGHAGGTQGGCTAGDRDGDP